MITNIILDLTYTCHRADLVSHIINMSSGRVGHGAGQVAGFRFTLTCTKADPLPSLTCGLLYVQRVRV